MCEKCTLETDNRCSNGGSECATPLHLSGYGALVQALDEYIEFLNGANHGPVSFAYVHGWRCPQEDITKGVQLRDKIAELRKGL